MEFVNKFDVTRKVSALDLQLTNGLSHQQVNAAHKTDRFNVTRNAPVLGLLLTKLKFSTQQEDIKFTKYEETYAVEVKRLALYDTGGDKGLPREGLTTPALVLSTRGGLTTTPATTRSSR